MLLLIIRILVVLCILAIIAFCSIFRVVRVSGRSMYPTFHEGDILLARRVWVKREKPVIGKIYFYHKDDIRVIKRLVKAQYSWIQTLCFFVGDNAPESYDSRDYGWVRWKSAEWVYLKTLFRDF